MRRSTFDDTRDQSTADRIDRTADLMCKARGCPNHWSTSIGNLCRWHSAADPSHWPEVTEQQQWDETERARLNGMPKPPAPVLSAQQRRELLQRMGEALRQMSDQSQHPRRWAQRLQERDQRGDALTATQREMYRSALKQGAALE